MTGLHDGDDDEFYGCQTPGLDKLLRVYSAALQLVWVTMSPSRTWRRGFSFSFASLLWGYLEKLSSGRQYCDHD
jgi:hypothetical protein